MPKISVEDSYFHSKNSIRLGNKLFSLDRPKVMGIINCTPDSFHENSRFQEIESVLLQANKLISEGADILDIGGYSTRPGAEKIDIQTEKERTTKVIESIRKAHPGIVISIDTFRSEVAEAAILAGADIINDISGGTIDPKIFEVAAQYKCPYILMHMRGTETTMHELSEYSNLFKDIVAFFSEKIEILKSKGVNDIILDPGFGFSKTIDQNYELLNRLEDFQFLGHPVLVGFSRKTMIWKKLGITSQEALNGTTVLNSKALLKGAKILRVHDVKEARETVDLLSF